MKAGTRESPEGRAGLVRACAFVALSPLGAAAGFAWAPAWLLPILSAAPAYAAMAGLLKAERRRAAIAVMLAWAFLLAVTMTSLCLAWPERASSVVIHGAAYWDEMKIWLETGRGSESTPSIFLPQHALHAALFIVLSLVSGSVLSILLGTVMMGYMSYYVAHVAAQAPAHPFLSALLGWHPWSVVRVAAFIVLGVVLAEPGLRRVQGRRTPNRGAGSWIGLALAGLCVDAVLKAALATPWSVLLRSLR